MKRPFLADTNLRLLSLILAVALALCLCGCRTTAGTDHDQIVKAAIDLANSYTRLERYEDALSVYDRALLEADDYRLNFNKAVTLSLLGQNSQAAALCADSFDRYPYVIAFKTAQARYLRLAGENTLSRDAYEKVLELNPYDRQTRSQLIEDLISDGENKLAYENALVMWNQGYRDAKTVGYLYSLDESRWETVYRQLNPTGQ